MAVAHNRLWLELRHRFSLPRCLLVRAIELLFEVQFFVRQNDFAAMGKRQSVKASLRVHAHRVGICLTHQAKGEADHQSAE